MEVEILHKSCRICLKECNKMRSIYVPHEDEEPPCEMLHKLTGIRYENEEEHTMLPKQICRNCICELTLSYQFREKALKSQTYIELYLVECVDVLEENELEANSIDDFNGLEQAVLSNQELPTDMDYKSETKDKFDCVENKDKPANIKKRKKGIGTFERRKVQNEIATVDTQFVDESQELIQDVEQELQVLKSRKKKTISKERDNLALICDICGNFYAKRGRLTEHRRNAHGTESLLSCELCGEKFRTREILRRHMFTHMGGRPYKCSYCSRTFFYESGKKAHEAVHAGIKPFICEICNRAFAYSHALSKHSLIHADIKLYHCHLCNKDFRLQHHMKQHEETKAHQNRVKNNKSSDVKLLK